jgi:hypothetical protein
MPDTPRDDERPPSPEEPVPYTPNHIPVETRWAHVLVSGGLIIYGLIGLWLDDLYMPGKRGRGLHFHGLAAQILFAAFVSGCCNLLSVVVDHYDRRNNETNYRLFAQVTSILGLGLLVAALVVGLWTGTAGRR